MTQSILINDGTIVTQVINSVFVANPKLARDNLRFGTGTKVYTVTVVAASSLTLSPTSLANATAFNPYSAVLSATGGSGTYSFTVSAGTLRPSESGNR